MAVRPYRNYLRLEQSFLHEFGRSDVRKETGLRGCVGTKFHGDFHLSGLDILPQTCSYPTCSLLTPILPSGQKTLLDLSPVASTAILSSHVWTAPLCPLQLHMDSVSIYALLIRTADHRMVQVSDLLRTASTTVCFCTNFYSLPGDLFRQTFPICLE